MRGTPLFGSVLAHYPLRRRTAHGASGRRVAALATALAALALAAPTGAATAPATTTAAVSEPVYDEDGRLVETPFVPPAGAARLTEQQAIDVLFRHGKVRDWLARYPPDPQTDADYRPATDEWVVKAWSGKAGQIVLGKVDDSTGAVREAWTGPQVAWTMARGGAGAFGGKTINNPWVWLTFCALFLLGLADLRRLLSLRNLDLLALLSFTVSLRFFNEGEIFWSAPLAYPPLLYLLGRCVWIARRDRAPRSSRATWPVWLLAGAAVFLAGFRIGLNVEAPRSVIDVGFAGVIGGQRIVNGQMPYGHMPEQGDLEPCGPADSEGEIRERIQTNGRCEASNGRGDTYGPVSYLAYVPGYLAFGWSGKWDELWAAHATSLLFDGLCLVGLALVGRRYGGNRLAATLAFAWAAYPFTLYVANSNTNDAIMPAFLIWGFWLASSQWARGAAVALAGWTKFAALLLAPLWLTYPEARRAPSRRFVAGVRARHRRGVHGPPARARAAARGACLRRAHVRLPARPRVPLLDLGLGPVPRQRRARPAPRPAGAPGPARGRCSARRLRAPAPLAAPAGGADRRAPDRLRARADALVLPLHPLVLPLRRLRGAGDRDAEGR